MNDYHQQEKAHNRASSYNYSNRVISSHNHYSMQSYLNDGMKYQADT